MEENLIRKIKTLNRELELQYEQFEKLTSKDWQEYMQRIGSREIVEPFGKKELKEISKNGGILFTDASSNRFGGAYPHLITLFRGVCISTINRHEEYEKVEAYIPLLENSQEVISSDEVKKLEEGKLAEIEIKVTLEALEKTKPHILLMDGSLIRFAILQENLWEQLKEYVLKNDIILAGVIEDIKTSVLYDRMTEEEKNKIGPFYDKEALFNHLEYQETLILHNIQEGKENYGLSSAFLRSSKDPTVIGVDLLTQQEDAMKEVLSLILSITDVNSRGIPFLLDYVDQRSRITDSMIEELLKMHLNTSFYEKFYRSQRSKRTF